MSRVFRIILGLALIGYGVYSKNYWFFLGIIPLVTGLINWCPLNNLLGDCSDGKCDDGSCCSPKEEIKQESSCCTPPKQTPPTNIKTFTNTPTGNIKKGVTQILILGTGCAKCAELTRIVKESIKDLDGEFEVKKVEDIEDIMKYNVLSTPGLVINGKVKSTGKVLPKEEIIKLIEEERNNG